jgi:hypothetical protein
MFRDRIFEWSRVFSLMVDSWAYIKILPELSKHASTASARAATINTGIYKAEISKTVSRAYIAPA